MKIWIVNNYYFPLNYNENLGGLETISIELYKMLKYPHSVKLLAPSNSKLEEIGVDFIPFENKAKTTLLEEAYGEKVSFNKECGIGKIIDDNYYPLVDLVISNTTSLNVLRILADKAAYHTKIVHFVHNTCMNMYDVQYYKDLLTLKKKHPKIKIVAVSTYLEKVLNDQFEGLVDHVLASTFIEPTTMNTHLSDECKHKEYFIYAGRIVRDKQVDVICDAFPKTGKYYLILAGNLSDHPAEKQWQEEDLKPSIANNNVVFVGSKERSELFSIIKHSKGMIVFHPFEAFSLSAFEAQKLGVPVIANKKGIENGIGDYMIDGSTGRWIETYRMRKPKVSLEIAKVLDEVADYDREGIEYVFEKYSKKDYLNKLMEIVNG